MSVLHCKWCGRILPKGRLSFCSKRCWSRVAELDDRENKKSMESMRATTCGPKKPLPCLGCGRMMFTDRNRRICAACHKATADIRLPERVHATPINAEVEIDGEMLSVLEEIVDATA